MFVLERQSGDVIAISTLAVETRISVVESQNGRFILTIEATGHPSGQHQATRR